MGAWRLFVCLFVLATYSKAAYVVYDDQLDLKWVPAISLVEKKPGGKSGVLFFELDAFPVSQASRIVKYHVGISRNAQNGKSFYAVEDYELNGLKSGQTVMDKDGHEVMQLQSWSFNPNSGGKVTLRMLKEGSVWGPSHDEFSRREMNVDFRNGRINIEVANDRNNYVPFDLVEIFPWWKGIERVIFRDSMNPSSRTFEFKL